MQNSVEIMWPDVLEAMYGTVLSERQVAVWEHYLIEVNATGKELCDCIEMAACEGISVKFRVTVQDLRDWLKKYRAVQNAKRDAAKRSATIDGITKRLREKFLSGASKTDIADAIDGERKNHGWISIMESNAIFDGATK